MRQASWAGNIAVELRPSLKMKRGGGKEKTNECAAEENKAIFRRYAEKVGNQHNFEIVDEIFERYISHQPDGSTLVRGPEDVKRFQEEHHSAFPNFHISIEEQIAEGDKVVSHYTIRGIHQRAFRDMAPTGREIELKGVTTFRFSPEGKVVETWDSYDQLSLMRQSTEQELRLARSIQRASLPKEVPTLEGWQISPFYRPAREVGGDFYDVLDPNSGSLSYANAGHDLPYLHCGRGNAEELRARGMPLGLMPGMGYEEKEIVLEAGEATLFYSDGLVEAHDPEGHMFSFPRLRALIAQHAEKESLEKALLEELYSFVGEGWEQEDDITLLALRRSASLS